jgi:hypothetical protein
MLQWVSQTASHAFAPVFKYRPAHPVTECSKCAHRLRESVTHINPHLPLEYQKDVEIGTNIHRFSLVVNRVEGGHVAKDVGDVFRTGYQCRINRTLDICCKESIQPTLSNIRSELECLKHLLKGLDRLLIYVHDISDENLSIPELNIVSDRHYIWIVTTSVRLPPNIARLLTCTYTYHPRQRFRSERNTSSTTASSRVFVLRPQTIEHRETFTAKWLSISERNRHRVTVARLLAELAGEGVFVSSEPININTTYFGF